MLRAEIIREWEKVKNKFTSLGHFKQKVLWEATEQNQPLPEVEIITRIQQRRIQLLDLQETLNNHRPHLEHCRQCPEEREILRVRRQID